MRASAGRYPLKCHPMDNAQSFLVVDDHPMIRLAMADALRARFPELRVESRGSAEDALELLKVELKKSKKILWWVLIDLGLPGLGGLAAIRHVLELGPQIKIITISGSDDELQVGACLGAGSTAFISKGAPMEDMIALVSLAVDGSLQIGAWLTSSGAADSASIRRIALTDRQLQVLSMICEGNSNKQIADSLGITEITAKSHVGAIFRELQVVSRTQAVLVAQRLGLFTNKT